MARLRAICSILVIVSAGLVILATPVPAAAAQVPYDDIWQFADWYDNPDNDFVQNVHFSGRFQYEFAALDADEGSHDEWNVRRMRLGVKTLLFDDFTVHVEAEFNPEEADPFYRRLTDTYVEWSRSETLALTVGKQGVPFTMDGSTSSKELLTIDRSNLANNMWFPEEYIPGISVSGERNGWVYQLGGFTGGERNREFGEFNGSAFGIATIGYQLSELLGSDDALLRANYIYQNPDANNTFTRQLQHMLSINFSFEAGRWGFRTDVSSGAGYLGQSDLWGSMVMPYFNVTDKLQVVGRYTYVTSEEANGVRLARYETQVTGGRGDRYDELYAGVNYYFYGHKLKLQSGLQFADMDDIAADGGAYNGVSSVTGLRVSW